ncbi:MAG: rhodanese-like domain-containing protein [Spirochaetaceae bacterium]|nr:MAG: rhodanese-like domain-containing protein [Spirochaetaceae bacterium]
MNRSVFLNLLVITVAVAFAAIVAVPAQETIGRYGDPRDPSVLERLLEEVRDDFLLVDVRTGMEFAQGHIPGAIQIDYRVIADALAEADRSRPVVVYCRTGNRSSEAERTLRTMGFSEVYDFGGINRWPGALLR